jgi:hypothetical protein
MKFTLNIYKKDGRTKAGERFVAGYDYDRADRAAMEREVKELYPLYTPKDGYRFEIRETYVKRKNIMTGQEVEERYDTPYACSVSSEAYWSN